MFAQKARRARMKARKARKKAHCLKQQALEVQRKSLKSRPVRKPARRALKIPGIPRAAAIPRHRSESDSECDCCCACCPEQLDWSDPEFGLSGDYGPLGYPPEWNNAYQIADYY